MANFTGSDSYDRQHDDLQTREEKPETNHQPGTGTDSAQLFW